MVELSIEIPVTKPLKESEKKRLINGITSSFETVGIAAVEITESYYKEARAAIEPLALVLVISIVADLLTIALALKEFLSSPEGKNISEFRLKGGSIVIKGNMSSDDIVKIVDKVKEVDRKREKA